MTRRLTILLALLLLPGAARATAFDDAMKAVAAGNHAAALPLFESALSADPDDLKSANEYRKAVIRTKEYDRAIAFFDKLTAQHPQAAYAWLNFGYTYVDKIPDAGSITQVILANNALTNFSKSIELTVERAFGGHGGDPTFAQMIDTPELWSEYADAFA